jgi:hypothetical protein
MKPAENNTKKEETPIKPLPGNVKVTMGESMVKKIEHSKAVASSIKGYKKKI